MKSIFLEELVTDRLQAPGDFLKRGTTPISEKWGSNCPPFNRV